MRRRLLTLFLITSTLLCLAGILFWIDTSRALDSLAWSRKSTFFLRLLSLPGETPELEITCAADSPANLPLAFTSTPIGTFPPPTSRISIWSMYTHPHLLRSIECSRVKLFAASTADVLAHKVSIPPSTPVGITLRLPWSLATALLAAPLLLRIAAAAVTRARRRHAVSHNRCPVCRYDLRAHTPGQSCPECGTPLPPVASP